VNIKFLLPVVGFAVLTGFLYVGLSLDPREVPSPLIGKPAPAFDLFALDNQKRVTPDTFRGQVWVLNVWASWCVSCREEHPLFVDLAKRGELKNLVGLNYKDQSAPAKRWLSDLGNPYVLSVVDAEGRVGIDYGVYGVPETFIIDKRGVIRYKQIGPVNTKAWLEKIKPLLNKLEAEV
jgi:cytochrome c biogenesis protein CcmG, thiol:disulfide interchange protein DsbE